MVQSVNFDLLIPPCLSYLYRLLCVSEVYTGVYVREVHALNLNPHTGLTLSIAPSPLPSAAAACDPPVPPVRHEQHLRVGRGHAGLHQLAVPDQGGAEGGLPRHLGPRRSLQARPLRGAEDAVARPMV